MPIIFSSGCYVPYIYTIIAPLSQASPVFDLLFYRSAGPFYYTFVHCGVSVCSCTWRWLPHPDSVLYNGTCKNAFAREIEVIMRVRVRLRVSCRMHESWQLCSMCRSPCRWPHPPPPVPPFLLTQNQCASTQRLSFCALRSVTSTKVDIRN